MITTFRSGCPGRSVPNVFWNWITEIFSTSGFCRLSWQSRRSRTALFTDSVSPRVPSALAVSARVFFASSFAAFLSGWSRSFSCGSQVTDGRHEYVGSWLLFIPVNAMLFTPNYSRGRCLASGCSFSRYGDGCCPCPWLFLSLSRHSCPLLESVPECHVVWNLAHWLLMCSLV